MNHKEEMRRRQVQKEFGLDATLTQATLHDREAANIIRKIGKNIHPSEEYLGSVVLHFYRSGNVLMPNQVNIAYLDMLIGANEGASLASSVSEQVVNSGIKMLAKNIIQHYKG